MSDKPARHADQPNFTLRSFKLDDPPGFVRFEQPTSAAVPKRIPPSQVQKSTPPIFSQQTAPARPDSARRELIFSDEDSGDDEDSSMFPVNDDDGLTVDQQVGIAAAFVLPPLETCPYPEFRTSVVVPVRRPFSSDMFSAPFTVPVSAEILRCIASAGPFRVLSERLELVSFSCNDATAECSIHMDKQFLNRVPYYGGRTGTTGMVACHLPFGRSDAPQLIWEFSAIKNMTRAELQREYRYRRCASSADLMRALTFDDSTAAHGSTPDDSPLIMTGPYDPQSAPVMYTLYLMSLSSAEKKVAADELAIRAPRRSDFTAARLRVDTKYFQGERSSRLYAADMKGAVCANKPCDISLSFAVRTTRVVLARQKAASQQRY